MADMIKFFKGAVASLPTTGANGAIYITTDEGGIYLGTGTGMKRLGDFIQVDAVANLPTNGANTSALYYCVAENVLAKWNGSEWTQINKQRTKEETIALLGLGSMAYKSEVAEGDLNADLKAKVNAAAEGNHSHDNKALLDTYTQTEANLADAVAKKHAHSFSDEAALNGITAAKVADWDDAVSKEHTHTFVDTDVEDAISKKHSHTFVESELNKIAAGDVAKWNGVVADHLKATDKEALEDSIGDVNTALENYKTSNNEALAGVKATAEAAATKEYADAELAKKVAKTDYEADKATFATKTELNGVDAKFAQYNTTTTQKAIDDAQDAEIAKKADAEAMTTALAGKVDKAEGKSLIADSEIARLADVHNYDDTQVKADIAKKADSATMTTELGKKVDKVEGYSLVADTEIARLADVDNYDDAEVRGLIGDNADAIGALADKVGTVPGGQTVMGIITNIQENAYDDTELRGLIGDNADAIDAVEGRMDTAEGKITTLETESAKHAIKTEVEGALALKADKSVVDAMYTNAQIDGFIAEAKKYADDHDADTKYGIVYDSDNKKIKLVEGGTDVEIDASAFIKDGMISNVTIGTDNDLVITFNTDAGKENIVLPLDQLVDIYTGVEGDRIKVTVNADKSISADLVAGSISKDCLDAGVKASLALADSALQSHQDISHLATKTELQGVDGKFANYTNTTDMNAKFDLKADKTQVATDIENAVKAETERATGAENGLAGRIKDLEDNKAGYATTGEVATAKGEAIVAAETKAGELDAALKTEIEGTITSGDEATLASAKSYCNGLLEWGSF